MLSTNTLFIAAVVTGFLVFALGLAYGQWITRPRSLEADEAPAQAEAIEVANAESTTAWREAS